MLLFWLWFCTVPVWVHLTAWYYNDCCSTRRERSNCIQILSWCVYWHVMVLCVQVEHIVDEATSLDNLCVLYEGWTPWVWGYSQPAGQPACVNLLYIQQQLATLTLRPKMANTVRQSAALPQAPVACGCESDQPCVLRPLPTLCASCVQMESAPWPLDTATTSPLMVSNFMEWNELLSWVGVWIAYGTTCNCTSG